jgi:endoglucanase
MEQKTRIKNKVRRFITLCAIAITVAITFSCRNFVPRQPPTIPADISTHIKIDQFGYRPNDSKIAVISEPQQGFNGNELFNPGKTYQVRRWDDNSLVFSEQILPWQESKTQSTSGDKGWWFDFSSLTTSGSYYIFDPQNEVRSYPFDIDNNVYRPILLAATRMFFYNRSGFAKQPPFADPKWTDDAAFVGPRQDGEARYLYDKNNSQTARDLSGGWFDAGDTNKYVTFAQSTVHQLLTAYTENPKIWTDDFNLPESGNEIPDLIDEIKWEMDWLQKMQNEDGGVLIKIGTLDYNNVSPPSQDKRPRYYAPACSSSTIAAASMFAHGAIVFNSFPSLSSYAQDLQNRAIKAWNWYQANPKRDDCDSLEIKSGDADWELDKQEQESVVAAIYLFALTGDRQYDTYIEQNYSKTRPYWDNGWSRYDPEQGDALLYYSKLPQGNTEVKRNIIEKKQQDALESEDIYQFIPQKDLYRAYITDSTYHWGSNQTRANNGNTNYDVVFYHLDPSREKTYEERALEILHYFHGVNPFNLVYLSNMYAYGAENSVNEIWHDWFADGTKYDNALTSPNGPAPGYLTGGPNKNYTGSASPPLGEPYQKAYKDWNDAADKAWEITEPAIYYQSAYLKLLSKFIEAR